MQGGLDPLRRVAEPTFSLGSSGPNVKVGSHTRSQGGRPREGRACGLVALQGFNPLTPLRQSLETLRPASAPELGSARALEPFREEEGDRELY